MKPVIGVTLDSENGGGYSDHPWYALRQNYMSSLAACGAVPLALPHLNDCAAAYLDLCNGIVVTGGTLIQHIPDEVEASLQHSSTVDSENGGGRARANHDIVVYKGTLLSRVTGVTTMPVNSSHHQSVKSVGSHCRINAIASDGVIEGIEYVPARFCLGVQWHPEYLDTEFDKMILQAFVKAAAFDLPK